MRISYSHVFVNKLNVWFILSKLVDNFSTVLMAVKFVSVTVYLSLNLFSNFYVYKCMT